MEFSERRWALWCEAIRVWLLLTSLLLIRGSILNMSEIPPMTMWAAYWWDCLKKTFHCKPVVVYKFGHFSHPLEKLNLRKWDTVYKSYCFPKPFCPCSQWAQFLSRAWAPQKELGMPEISLRVLCFLERENSGKGLGYLSVLRWCQHLGRKSRFQAQYRWWDWGRECCSAGVPTDPHLQPSAVSCGVESSVW